VGWANSFIVCPPFADKNGGQKSVAHPTWLTQRTSQPIILVSTRTDGKVISSPGFEPRKIRKN
jgi:hypothetical protein